MTEDRTYRVIESADDVKIYHGFDKHLDPIDTHIVIYLIDGEFEIFCVDDPNDHGDLPQYLKDQWDDYVIEKIGVFSRHEPS